MNLAEQLQRDINFNKIISQLQRELVTKDRVLISSNLSDGNVERLREEGFKVDTDGQQYNGGVFVSFKVKSQYG